MMRLNLRLLLQICLIAILGVVSMASDASVIPRGTKNQAVAMVKMAEAYLKVHGPEKAYAEFTNPEGQFVVGDMYVFVHDMNGKCLAHGQNPKLVGKDMIDVLDADGKPYLRERMEMAKTHASFWQEYKFSDPITKKIRPKESYCEHTPGGPVICAGIYKE